MMRVKHSRKVGVVVIHRRWRHGCWWHCGWWHWWHRCFGVVGGIFGRWWNDGAWGAFFRISSSWRRWRHAVGGIVHTVHGPLQSRSPFVRLIEEFLKPVAALRRVARSRQRSIDDCPASRTSWGGTCPISARDIVLVDLPIPRKRSAVGVSPLLNGPLVVWR